MLEAFLAHTIHKLTGQSTACTYVYNKLFYKHKLYISRYMYYKCTNTPVYIIEYIWIHNLYTCTRYTCTTVSLIFYSKSKQSVITYRNDKCDTCTCTFSGNKSSLSEVNLILYRIHVFAKIQEFLKI